MAPRNASQPKDKSLSASAIKAANTSKNKSKDQTEEPNYVFSIEPETITLNPKTWINF